MRLKTLELQGFKSFPDKTVIAFDRGVTVVVGPNGSGKSNISDAMRWVLGEMSSKSMRGSKMEDVVFAGSQKRSPMGYAEVSVTFDNTEENGKIMSMAEYDEITVTRRYYRVGNSEYFINRKPVRLRDIQELFLNTGLGKDGYSIIGQGRIAEIISQKNDDRRAIFEEAAGIARYRYQKNDAAKKLEHVDENLVRLQDIAGMLGERVGPLEKDSEKAKKYLELYDAKMALDIALSVFNIEKAKATVKEMSEKMLLAKKDLDEADDTRASLEQMDNKAHEDNMAISMEKEKNASRILELTENIHAGDAKLRLSENDREHLGETVKQENLRIAEAKTNLTAAEAEENRIEKELTAANTENGVLTKKNEEITDRIAALEREIGANEGFAIVYRARIAEIKEAQTGNVVASSVAAAKKEADAKKTADIKEDIESHKADIQLMEDRVEKAKEKIASYVEKENALRDKLDAHNAKLSENESKTAALQDRKNTLFLDISQRKHKIQNLVRMEELLEGYSGAVRFLMKEHGDRKVLLRDGRPVTIYGPVSKLITVPDEYSAALEVAFGQSLQNIVCDNEESAKAAIAHLKKKNAGRATLYPVSTMHGFEVAEKDIPMSCRDGFVSVASALVNCDEKFRGIIKSLVGRILICKTIDDATKLAKAMNFRYRIVTLDGQVINAGGSFTGGSLSQDGRMLSRRVQIEKLNEEVAALTASDKKVTEDLQTLADEKEELKKEGASTVQAAAAIKTMHDAESTQLTVLTSTLDAEKKMLRDSENELSAILADADQAENDLSDMDKQKSVYETELAEAEKKLSSLGSKKVDLEDDLTEQKDMLSESTLEMAKLASKTDMLSEMLDGAKNRTAEIRVSIAAMQLSVKEAEEKIAGGTSETDLLQKEIAANQAELAKAEEEKTALILRAEEIEKRISELRIKLHDIGDKRDNLYRVYTNLESKYTSGTENEQKLTDFLWEEYHLPYTAAAAKVTNPITEETVKDATAEQTKYKNRIRALGSVNVGAIEEYKQVKTEFDELTKQIDDLLKSKESLSKIIAELEETMRNDFTETVKEIDGHFGKVFRELFGGGHAEIKLSDPDNVLESGIDINVAPPGKVITNMSLLSGGEQAFVAIALYFAILEVNPSPFCILDEIEAALDTTNVDIFADYVKKYSDKTQFVVITHRRGTMEAAERLYGVTMHEKGISDVISIDVSEIEQKIGVKLT